MRKRKCEVSGTDEPGDVHTFAAEGRERAEELSVWSAEMSAFDQSRTFRAARPRHEAASVGGGL